MLLTEAKNVRIGDVLKIKGTGNGADEGKLGTVIDIRHWNKRISFQLECINGVWEKIENNKPVNEKVRFIGHQKVVMYKKKPTIKVKVYKKL